MQEQQQDVLLEDKLLGLTIQDPQQQYIYSQELEDAAKIGNLQKVKSLIEQGFYVDQIKTQPHEYGNQMFDNKGYTPLMYAVENGHVPVVEYLIAQKADLGKQTHVYFTTALSIAAETGNLQMVNLLIANGVDVNQIGKYGKTAVILAAEKGYLDIVRMLHQAGADINKKGCFICGPEHLNRVLRDNTTALASAAWTGKFAVVKFLVEHGAEVDVEAQCGYTALMCAAQYGDVSTIEYLSSQGADIKKISGDVDALYLAAGSGSLEVVKWLTENGVNIRKQNSRGRTALHAAITGSRDNCAKVAEYLIAQQADVNQSGEGQRAPLILSCHENRPKITRMLLEHDVKIGQIDEFGYTALMWAVIAFRINGLVSSHADYDKQSDPKVDLFTRSYMENLAINAGNSIFNTVNLIIIRAEQSLIAEDFKALLDAQSKFAITNSMPEGRTALIFAAEKGYLDVVELLIDKGASLDLKDMDGNTAKTLAIKNNHLAIIDLIEQKQKMKEKKCPCPCLVM